MRMDFCLSSDDNYAKYMATTMSSILSNTDKDDDIYFHIIDGGITQENKNKIEYLKKIKDFKINFYDIKNAKYKYNSPHFYRLNIPSIIPNIDKILYLDCDTIVLKSLKELFEIDISEHYAIVVEDGNLNSVLAYKRMIGLSDHNTYFNSGMMMINNKLWIKDKLDKKFNKDIKENKRSYADQDTLNIVLKDKTIIVDKKWNFLAYKKVNNKIISTDNINIIHYVSSKPWTENTSKVFLTDEFWKYYQLTPWFRENPLDAVRIMINQKIGDYEETKLDINRIKFIGFYKNKDKIQIVILFIKITIELNLNTINKIAWWIPIKSLRDKFRSKALD